MTLRQEIPQPEEGKFVSRVLLHIDFDWWKAHQADALRHLSPLLLAQEAGRAANVYGVVYTRRVHALWETHPESDAQSFRAEGFHLSPSLSTPEGWATLKESFEASQGSGQRLTVVLISGDRSVVEKTKAVRKGADELVIWLEGEMVVEADAGIRVDTLSRVFQLRDPGCCLILDFQGFVELVASRPEATDVESILDRLHNAARRFGAPTFQLAFADWHMLPVLRDRAGDPMTHEVQALLRAKGYKTVEVHSELSDQTDLSQSIARSLRGECAEDTVLFVGRSTVFDRLEPVLNQTGREISSWSDYAATVPEGISWQPLEDVLSESERRDGTSAVSTTDERLLPGLWSRVALFADRLMQDAEHERIGEKRLAKALATDAPFVSGIDQSRSLLVSAVAQGILTKHESKGRGGEPSYQINVDHPLLVFIQELLKRLVEVLGEEPGNGGGRPLSALVDDLASAERFASKHQLDRRGLLCWINYLVEEGVLIRFGASHPEYGTGTVPCVAFSPAVPPAEKESVVKDTKRDSSPKARQSTQSSTSKAPAHVRDLLLVAVDNHIVRHRRAAAPASIVRRHMAFCPGRIVDDVLRECIRVGDIKTARQSSVRSAGKNVGLTLNQDSKAVRNALSRRDRVLGLLKQMAPMGQPIGEERLYGELISKARFRDREEVSSWVALFLNEHLLKKERQLAVGIGPSYTQTLDDPNLMQAQRRFGGKDYRRKNGRRRGKATPRRGSGRPTGRRRRT
jgi:hypothetical protein